MLAAGVTEGAVPSSSFAEIANRVSHAFGLTGPSLAVDTMCSSALTALHLACDALRRGDCTLALAGGVNLSLRPEKYRQLIEGSFLSSDGRCRSYGEGGDGYVPGEGCGVVVLKPLDAALADGDPIRAVIRATAINHGGRARGFTVPNPDAQAAVIAQALERAGLAPRDIDMIEGHGTGTSLGDPIEITALARVFTSDQAPKSGWPIGSVKSQIGHLEAAAGMAGLAKLVLQLEHQRLYPSLHAETLNGNVDWASVPFAVQRTADAWAAPDGRPRRAVLSSFGAGGSNAHLVIEEAPAPAFQDKQASGPVLIPLSARTPEALQDQCAALLRWLDAARETASPNILPLLARVLAVDARDLSETDALEDLGVDAHALDRFASAVAGGTGVTLTPSALASARTVGDLAALAGTGAAVPLMALARTLALGRLEQSERLAIVARSDAELRAALRAMIDGTSLPDGAHRNRASEGTDAEAATREAGAALKNRDLAALAVAWAQGATVDWPTLLGSGARLHLPPTVLQRRAYWYTRPEGATAMTPAPAIAAQPAPAIADTSAKEAALLETWRSRAADYAGDAVLLDVSSGIAVITLNQPESHNMLDDELALGLTRALDAVAADETARVVVLRSSASVFSLGGTPQQLLGIADGTKSFTDTPVFYRGLLDCPLPVISAMAGRAHGGGMLLGLYADMPVLGCEAPYAAVFTDYGFSPGMGATLILPHRLGPALSHEMMYSASPMTGAALAARGVDLAVHPQADVERAAMRLAASLATKPRETLMAMKRTFAAPLLAALPLAVAREEAMHARTFALPQVRNGLARRFGAPAPSIVPPPAPTRPVTPAAVGPIRLRPVEAPGETDDALATIREMLATLLMMESADVAPDRALTDQGLDSIGAVELTRQINAEFGTTYAVTDLYDHPTPLALARLVGTNGGPVAKLRIPARADGPIVLRLVAGFAGNGSITANPQPAAAQTSSDPAPVALVSQSAISAIAELAADALQMQPGELDHHRSLADQGLDSIGLIELARALSKMFNKQIEASDLYDYPSVSELARHLDGTAGSSAPVAVLPARVPEPVIASLPAAREPLEDPVAIIGLAGRFPAAADAETFWQNLLAGVDAVTEIPAGRWAVPYDPDPQAEGASVSRWGGFIDDVAAFDAAFFAISPMEAEQIDPQQRLALECGWHALEDAAIAPSAMSGKTCGIFMGASVGDYEALLEQAGHDRSAEAFTGLSPSILTARLAYLLNLTGPAVALETACSSSLVALHMARRAILDGDCDMALAGGVNLMTTPRLTVRSSQAGMLSPTGRCRPFSDAADGIALSEGVGMLVLKRLSTARRDGDPVRAILRGTGVNQDGRTNGMTAPSAKSQAALISKIQRDSHTDPETIGYLETHGTGTDLGDPIEFKALRDVFHDVKEGACLLGSAKASIGHATVAAGVAGTIAAIRALETGDAPPLVHFEKANPRVDLANSPFKVAATRQRWGDDGIRRAAVSSFGFSGTNAHAILEQAETTPRDFAPDGVMTLVVSAKTAEALSRNATRLADWMERHDAPLADIALTLLEGRDRMNCRMAVTGSRDVIIEGLRNPQAPKPTDAADRALAEKLIAGETDTPDAWRAWGSAWASEEAERLDLAAPLHRLGARRCALPGYAFARTRFWVPDARSAAAPMSHVTEPHEVTLDPDAPVLADHLVRGRPVLPGTALLSLAFQAAGDHTLEARDVVWTGAYDDTSSPLSVTCGADGAFTVSSGGAQTAETHCTGTLVPKTPARVPADVEAIAARCETDLDVDAFYKAFAEHGLEHRGGFRRIGSIRLGSREALVTLAPGPTSSFGAPDPFILDAALHGVAALADDGLYLPVRLARFAAHAPLDTVRRVHLTELGGDGAERRFDALLLDDNGRVVAEAEGFTVRRVDETAKAATSKTLLLRPVWRACDLAPAGPAPLVLRQDGGMTWDEAGDWSAVDAHEGRPILALPDCTDPAVLYASLRDLALALSATGKPARLTLATTAPEAAQAMAGFARSFAQEQTRISLRAVLVDNATPPQALLDLGRTVLDEPLLRLDPAGVCTVERHEALEADATPKLSGAWLISGGGGGLGKAIADRLETLGATPIRFGRTPSEGVRAADVTDAKAIKALADDVRRAHGPINGIVHLAGTLRDARLADKKSSDWTAVLAPKIGGLEALLDALRDEPLESVVCFSSLAAVQGQAGQTDYAFANGWLNGLSAGDARLKIVAWPWWVDGGMQLPVEEREAAFRRSGIAPLMLEDGLAAFEHALAAPELRLVVAGGDAARITAWFDKPVERAAAQTDAAGDATGALDEAQALLSKILVTMLKLDPETVRGDRRFGEYGLESITLTRFANRISRRLEIDLAPAVLFEEDTLERLASRLVRIEARDRFAKSAPARQSIPAAAISDATIAAPTSPAIEARPVQDAPTQPDAPIAIIGMAGTLPGGADLDGFWEMLEGRRSAVTEIPAERWDWRAAAAGLEAQGLDGNRLRWGAFIDGIDQFDPAFFGISPREAELMDPQQRLFLETVWHAIENAGLDPAALAGSDTGLFAGVSTADYLDLMLRNGTDIEAHAATGMSHCVLPNRVSYLLDLHGPSEAIDTACSSSLVALARGVEAIRRGDCKMAIAGGVNALLAPTLYQAFGRAGMLSPSGACRSFDDGADGYVRGEGVGAVLLKRLDQALADGDPVHGVIRAVCVRHGGRASSLTAPIPIPRPL
ncbi:SDR family NAD(P)-dependent oxidoreductase [Breoghania sp. L-A4]|uniref:SDR family NAD(P)-dependent oxidoreductase n=1 Tax=Breoghania sp. L-A4 TaxID=2304600 RepID=UPI0013C2CE59|nr:SDR family NAD(P)-dependent oxidoreductase [Breoghania sp. L-A4]